MKRVKQVLCGVLAAALMIPLAAAAPGSGGKSLSDIQGHWAQKEIETAIASGWVDGYPDGTFQPEKTITRAEFTKMLLDAIHLTPDSETVAWMKENAKMGSPLDGEGWRTYTPKLYDMSEHWLTRQGWTDAALYSGMVVPDDYNGKNFRPEKAIARYEIALMTDRALGLVYPAELGAGVDVPFADNDQVLDWMKGYVLQATEAGVLKGYPDGTFRPNKTSTRAEAVVMVQRTLEYMEEGLGEAPVETVRVRYQESESGYAHIISDTILQEKETDQIRLQMVDNVIYAPLRDLYAVEIEMIRENGLYSKNPSMSFGWFPIEQQLEVLPDGGNFWFYVYQMGNTAYYWGEKIGEPSRYDAAMRSLYGEIMVPICDLDHPNAEPQEGWQAGWNAETKTLTIPMFYYWHYPGMS